MSETEHYECLNKGCTEQFEKVSSRAGHMAWCETDKEKKLTRIEKLRDAYLVSKNISNTANSSNISYDINRLIEFLNVKDLSYTDFDKGSDIYVQIESPEIDEDNELSYLDLMNYFILWLRDEEGYAESTIRTTYFKIRPFITYLLEEGEISYDPRFDKPGDYIKYDVTKQNEELKEIEKKKRINDEEHEALLEHVESPKFRNRVILKLLYETGMRRESVAKLKLTHLDIREWSRDPEQRDLHLESRAITIPVVKFNRSKKKPDPITIYVSSSLKKDLELWTTVKRPTYSESDSKYLFLADWGPNKGKIHKKRVGKVVRKAADNAGIQDILYSDKSGRERARISTHSYRHNFGFSWIENGGDLYALSEIMQHHSVEVTEKYLDSDDDYIQQQMDTYRPNS